MVLLTPIWYLTYFIVVYVYTPRTGAENPLGTKLLSEKKFWVPFPIFTSFSVMFDTNNFSHLKA